MGKKAKTVNKLANMEIAPAIGNPDHDIHIPKSQRIDGAGE